MSRVGPLLGSDKRSREKPEYRLVPGMQNCNSFRFP